MLNGVTLRQPDSRRKKKNARKQQTERSGGKMEAELEPSQRGSEETEGKDFSSKGKTEWARG